MERFCRKYLVLLFSTFFTVGCSDVIPEFKNLLSFSPDDPNWHASSENVSFRNPTDSISLSGTCSSDLDALEFSVDSSTFVELSSLAGVDIITSDVDCGDGGFSVSISQVGSFFSLGSGIETHTVQVRGFSKGKFTSHVKTNVYYFEPLPDVVTSVTAMSVLRTAITVSWAASAGTTSAYRLAYLVGSTAPVDCKSGVDIALANNQHQVTGLDPNTEYSFAVCSLNSNPIPDEVSGGTVTRTTLPPFSAPTGIAFVTPGASPSNIDAPTVQVSGVASGDTVKVYSDSACNIEVGSAVAAGATVDVVLNSLVEGSYDFSAKRENTDASNCSSASLSYLLDLTIPASFTIKGVTGNSQDSTKDNILNENSEPVIFWSSSSDTGGSGFSHYNVEVWANAGADKKCEKTNLISTSTSFNFSTVGCGLTPSVQQYSIIVKAYDFAGNERVEGFYGFTYNDAPTISIPGNADIYEDDTVSNEYTISMSDVISSLSCDSSSIDLNSSDTSVLPLVALSLHSGTDCILKIEPISEVIGSSTITLTVTDEHGRQNTATLAIDVQSLCDKPAYSSLTSFAALGTGAAGGSYKICTTEQFKDISNSACGANAVSGCNSNFKLKNDLDFSGAQIEMIASDSNKFTGIFEGNDKILTNYTFVYSPGESGLFSNVLNAEIKNLTLSNFTLATSNNYVGGLVAISTNSNIHNITVQNSQINSGSANYVGGVVGYMDRGNIHNVVFKGNSLNSSGDFVGGIVGFVSSGGGVVSNCISENDISGLQYVGGVVGVLSAGTVENCASIGDVSAANNYAGGLIGKSNGLISKSFFDGTVTANQFAGGLVGFSNGSMIIRNSFSVGSVLGNSNSGGLIGRWAYVGGSGGAIVNTYTISYVQSGSGNGGFIGAKDFTDDSVFTSNYWSQDNFSGFANNTGSGSTSISEANVTNIISSSTLTDQSTYMGWNFTNIWVMGSSGYPELLFFQ